MITVHVISTLVIQATVHLTIYVIHNLVIVINHNRNTVYAVPLIHLICTYVVQRYNTPIYNTQVNHTVNITTANTDVHTCEMVVRIKEYHYANNYVTLLIDQVNHVDKTNASTAVLFVQQKDENHFSIYFAQDSKFWYTHLNGLSYHHSVVVTLIMSLYSYLNVDIFHIYYVNNNDVNNHANVTIIRTRMSRSFSELIVDFFVYDF